MSKFYVAIPPLVLGTLALATLNHFSWVQFIQALEHIEPLSWKAIATSLFCGGLVGWERMMRKKELGMRTSMFIVLGTYIFTVISIHLTTGVPNTDPTRIIGQIVSGIGFLGAGVMFTKNNKVSGLTSAATIWFLAALGICIGANYLSCAVILTTIGVTILILINEIDDSIIKFSKRITSSTRSSNVNNYYKVVAEHTPFTLTWKIKCRTSRWHFWRDFDGVDYFSQDEAIAVVNSYLTDRGEGFMYRTKAVTEPDVTSEESFLRIELVLNSKDGVTLTLLKRLQHRLEHRKLPKLESVKQTEYQAKHSIFAYRALITDIPPHVTEELLEIWNTMRPSLTLPDTHMQLYDENGNPFPTKEEIVADAESEEWK